LRRILDILNYKLDMSGGAILLLRSDGEDELFLAAEKALEGELSGGVIYRRNEGVIGRVLDRCRAVIVPKISEEPSLCAVFPRGSLQVEDSSFICVPILLRSEPVGTLSALAPASGKSSLEDSQRTLEIIASVIANDLNNRKMARIETESLENENTKLRNELIDSFNYSSIVGSSNEMRSISAHIRQMASTDTTVLIRGEVGTGKELVASVIHYNSLRAKRPFIKVNCASLNGNLLESELFGHERGSFTGAYSRRTGRIEDAAGGTLFLDEIGELSLAVQVKILRVIQEKEFERFGGGQTLRSNVRIIASTTRDLEKAVMDGHFRQDLYYRINVFPIHIPPLRARKTDILELANHFVNKHSRLIDKNIRRISTPAINMLLTYYWPGNVRELENCIEHAILSSKDEVIHGHDYPFTLQMPDQNDIKMPLTMRERIKIIERDLIVDALKRHNGNIPMAAKELGLSGRMVRYKINDLEIEYEKIFGRRRGRARGNVQRRLSPASS
jgi:Nif-specific regulatory protein